MSRPVYDLEHESDGWWQVTRNGWRLDGSEFLTRDQAEAAIHSYELEDYEAEQEAREQDADRDDRMDRGDWEFHRDYDR